MPRPGVPEGRLEDSPGRSPGTRMYKVFSPVGTTENSLDDFGRPSGTTICAVSETQHFVLGLFSVAPWGLNVDSPGARHAGRRPAAHNAGKMPAVHMRSLRFE
jgi:hypothetical protein